MPIAPKVADHVPGSGAEVRSRVGFVLPLSEVGRGDEPRVGGKNASLGEMIRNLGVAGVRVPTGFATTTEAYRAFVEYNGLDPVIDSALAALESDRATVAQTGKLLRRAFLRAEWPPPIAEAIRAAYRALSQESGPEEASVAVRSSPAAEDLPDAGFAGQHDTYLNVHGERAVLDACRRCIASLFTDRGIASRAARGVDHRAVSLSVGVQRMVQAGGSCAGVMLTLDKDTGFDRIVRIDAAWGLGETVVQGLVDADEYIVFKPLLEREGVAPVCEKRCGSKLVKMVADSGGGRDTRLVPTSVAERDGWVLPESEILHLARLAVIIEAHYGCPMEVEWARDAVDGALYVVQARPEAVQSRRSASSLKSYRVSPAGPPVVTGLAIGDAAVSGRVRLVRDPSAPGAFPAGAILVAENTGPDWVPIMKKAAAIVTDHGGRTSHAAIVSRELGVPALIGAGDATARLKDDQEVTVSCTDGDAGVVYVGIADIQVEDIALDRLPATRTCLKLNLANPAAAFRWWRLPADGIGLARMEFVIGNLVRVHPMALAHFHRVTDPAARAEIEKLTRGYAEKADYFIDRLARGLARLAALGYPKPVIVRMSDFKTNEYANLLGGAPFEPAEANPTIGFRGASRYYAPEYRDGFALECRAIRYLRETLGFDNVHVMIPFCRTPEEADRVLAVMAESGLRRGVNGLRVYVMCEIPSNVILAEEFAARFDGFSVGSNDLTQLTLGVDRDSDLLAPLFDERSAALAWMIETVVAKAHRCGTTVGLCGEAPSTRPEFAKFLVQAGVDSISVNPSSFLAVMRNVAEAEAAMASSRAA